MLRTQCAEEPVPPWSKTKTGPAPAVRAANDGNAAAGTIVSGAPFSALAVSGFAVEAVIVIEPWYRTLPLSAAVPNRVSAKTG
jgi:hypothetical protein